MLEMSENVMIESDKCRDRSKEMRESKGSMMEYIEVRELTGRTWERVRVRVRAREVSTRGLRAIKHNFFTTLLERLIKRTT